ncbi:MAG: helix-turn-helix transcriptional regulator [Agathobacter sp.]|nr:helix-turn-helix transcriptional regulator [Agathobacter sp.]
MNIVMNINDTFGNNLSKVMKERRITTKQLAMECNLSESAISGYRTGRRLPNLSDFMHIAFILDVPMEELLYPESP